jgi:hypothetical protein
LNNPCQGRNGTRIIPMHPWIHNRCADPTKIKINSCRGEAVTQTDQRRKRDMHVQNCCSSKIRLSGYWYGYAKHKSTNRANRHAKEATASLTLPPCPPPHIISPFKCIIHRSMLHHVAVARREVVFSFSWGLILSHDPPVPLCPAQA